MNQEPVTAVIVGFGHRAQIYADYSLSHPDALKIVGIADPNPARRKAAAERYGFPVLNCFQTATELAAKPKFADAVINGTMDHQHFETAVPLLERGYDMLLEKPFAVNREEMKAILAVVHQNRNKVMICHVLRYAPFYREIKNCLQNGEIGTVINLQTTEHVSYHHLVTSYVRGKWGNSNICKTSMLLAKSCHDIDLMMWLMQPVRPAAVSSFGSRMQFRPENAPAQAGTRCTVDCPLVDACQYSAKRLYLDHPDQWKCYVWADLEHLAAPTDKDRLLSLQNGNPYNRCVFKCDNDVVDHQSVLLSFENGATGTHNMIGGAAKSERSIHIVGTLGEILGCFSENRFTIYKTDPAAKSGYSIKTIDLSNDEEGHGGGDAAITADFVDYIRTGRQSIACTAIDNSVDGHLTVFLADLSREKGGTVLPVDFSEFQ